MLAHLEVDSFNGASSLAVLFALLPVSRRTKFVGGSISVGFPIVVDISVRDEGKGLWEQQGRGREVARRFDSSLGVACVFRPPSLTCVAYGVCGRAYQCLQRALGTHQSFPASRRISGKRISFLEALVRFFVFFLFFGWGQSVLFVCIKLRGW